MRLHDLIELFLQDENSVEPSHDEMIVREREDTSSLADIVRILRELDGQYETEHRPR